MSKFSTVLVSNRLPISVKKIDGKLRFDASNGGLPTAMQSIDAKTRAWIGWPGIESDVLTDEDKVMIMAELAKSNCFPVFLTREQVTNFYEGYANDTLWPLFHYFQSTARYSDAYWQSYQEVNQLYLDATVSVTQSTALIWIHDYHLMLLPQLVRDNLPRTSIGFFLHIPFPSFEIYRLLPQRREILRGILGADLVSFHIYDYGRHFISSCQRLLGSKVTNDTVEYDGRIVKIGANPIGLDYKRYREILGSKEFMRDSKKLRETYKGQKLIVSVDRLDYTKGVIDRLQAFELLLREHPEYTGNITLIMVAAPSRTEVDAYKKLRADVEQAVSRINGMYGSVNWAPISYQFQSLTVEEIVVLLARADVGLVTPIRDGMNLVAKEYVASRKRPNGVLVLSEMAGAIDELPEALAVNPNSHRAVADALVQALEMPPGEQARRMKVMQRRLSESTVQDWSRDFMDQLKSIGDADANMKWQMTSLQERQIINRFRQAKKRLIILDYDGTLREFVKSPDPKAAAPSAQTKKLLRTLNAAPKTRVAIVSGRTRAALTGWFGRSNTMLMAAEHGGWTRFSGKWTKASSSLQKDKKRITEIMESYTERTAGSEIETKEFSMVWHYANSEPDQAYKRSRELIQDLKDALAGTDLAVHEGRNIVEVKSQNVSKAHVVHELLARYPADFVMAIGDDYTDEDMFRALEGHEGAVTIKVGQGETHARYQVRGVPDVIALLQKLSPTTNQLARAAEITKKVSTVKPRSLAGIIKKYIIGQGDDR